MPNTAILLLIGAAVADGQADKVREGMKKMFSDDNPKEWKSPYLAPFTPAEAAAVMQGFPALSSWREPLQAWPKQPIGSAEPGRPLTCWKRVELDMNGEELGKATSFVHTEVEQCMGLTDATSYTGITTAEECQQECGSESLCADWQFNPKTLCWMGNGYDCNAERSELEDESSGRWMHGDVTVLGSLTEKKIDMSGLLKSKGKPTDAKGDLLENVVGADICKKMCYSMIMCQYWQFNEDGECFVDNGMNRALDDGLQPEEYTIDSDDVFAGEYIEHYCPPPPVPPTPPAPRLRAAEPEKTDLTWLWILLGILAALILAAIAYYCLKPKPKKPTRKPVIKKEPEKPPVPVYRTVISEYGLVSTSEYQGKTTEYVGDTANPKSFEINRGQVPFPKVYR